MVTKSSSWSTKFPSPKPGRQLTAVDAAGCPLIRKGNRLPEKAILGSVNS